MQRVADQLSERDAWQQRPGPRANFTAVLCLAWPDGIVAAFEGKVYGHLVWPPRGTRGFGYDPMFVADGETLTFGEMEPTRKHAISHRARAFALFSRACLGA
jgi:XTP/dITP diphosphohydrolase